MDNAGEGMGEDCGENILEFPAVRDHGSNAACKAALFRGDKRPATLVVNM